MRKAKGWEITTADGMVILGERDWRTGDKTLGEGWGAWGCEESSGVVAVTVAGSVGGRHSGVLRRTILSSA